MNADKHHKTWGHLIRSYNDQAHGNVEQFSICSDDSIWSESNQDLHIDDESPDRSPLHRSDLQNEDMMKEKTIEFINNNTYETNCNINGNEDTMGSPKLFNKWLESAARFQPSENNYSWWAEDRKRRPESREHRAILTTSKHGRDEVEAAVALTALASAHILSP